MSLSKDDAAAALRDIEAANEKARVLRGYQSGGPYVLMWGLVWLVGNLTSQFAPKLAEPVWIVAVVGVMAASFVVGAIESRKRMAAQRTEEERKQAARIGRKMAASAVLSWVVLGSLAIVLPPLSFKQFDAVISLMWMFAYMWGGIWIGWRLFVVGAVAAAAILFGYVYMDAYFYLWMGVVGGGALIAGGVWMRKV